MHESHNRIVAPLLRHLVEITGHRDHSLLGLSVITALHQLLGARQARMLALGHFNGHLFVHPQLSIKNDCAVRLDDAGELRETIDNYPALAVGLTKHDSVIHQVIEGEHVLWLPVWSHEKVSVCFEVTSRRPYNAQTLEVIQGILTVYRNFQSLLDYSERDSLTGLLNRKTFDENFSRLVSCKVFHDRGMPGFSERRKPADGEGKWLAVVDIDHFKRVNDQFGHVYGDEVLLVIANIMRSSFRAEDRVFRFGGEEFVVLLRSATLDEAKKALWRFRAAVEQHVFPQVGKITVSVGFAAIGHETPVAILGHADQALYYAKTHGRNQVCHYDELIGTGELRSQVANDSVEFF
jgi:diguanylate cyclase (GGDEF)-like protein